MSGHVNRPGVYEDELGITLDHAINKLAGGMKGGKYKAAICGGISMGVLGPDQLDIKLDFDDVRFRGGCLGLGTAGMIVMNEHTRHGGGAAQLRTVLRPRELRAMHALPRGIGVDGEDNEPNIGRRRTGAGPGDAPGTRKDTGHHAGDDDLRPGGWDGLGDADVHQ